VNPGIYGLGGQIVTPVQGPFAGVADARKLLSIWALICGGGAGGANPVVSRPGPGGGGGGVIEITALGVMLQTAYSISIGAGGAIQTLGTPSQFGSIVALGGGSPSSSATGGIAAGTGPGVVISNSAVSPMTPSQGFAGGSANSGNNAIASGGGGAGTVGANAVSGASGNGGAGRSSSISGATYLYGGGGGGGSYVGSSTAGSGGLSGGGAGSSAVASAATSGAANSGGGGGGGSCNGTAASVGGAGGSGIVILRWNASQAQITLSSGLTFTRSTVGTDAIITITAGTGTVTWS